VRYSARARLGWLPPVLACVLDPAERVTPPTAVEATDGKDAMKGSQKPKKLGKKPAQKTLKERRTAKRAAAKHASRGLDV
jgi:hypothetical protein